MKVLLTGANGFVGSHILDHLLARGHTVSILLRTTSDTTFIADHLRGVEVHYGSLSDVDSLRRGVRGVDVVVHCAGKTKAVRSEEYYQVNAAGTRNVVEACNGAERPPRHLVLISSISACGPGTPSRPATEDDLPHPVSHYGRSKLMGERYVREGSSVPYTILRPPVVYGPRDRDLLLMFKAVRAGFLPLIGGGKLQVSAIFAGDVARAVLKVLGAERAFSRTYNVANPQPETVEDFLSLIAKAMGVRARRIHVPLWAVLAACALQEVRAVVTGTPSILNLQKVQEYKARAWVCSTDRIARELHFVPRVSLERGVTQTLRWYERHGWL